MKETLTLERKQFGVFTESLIYFLISRVFFGFIILISQNLGGIFTLFDQEHYINIAHNGYYHESVTAFFPMIPLAIKFLTIPGTIILNNICFYASIVLMKKLDVSKEMLLIFAISPMGFFSMLLYTEGVFYLLTIASWYLYTKGKMPLLMGVCLGLSVLTRSTGSLLFFAIFIGMAIDFFKHRTKLINIIIAYIPATLLALIYPVFLQVKFGNWKLFMDCQYEYWIRIKSNVFTTTLMSIKTAFTNSYPFEDFDAEFFARANEIITLIIFAFTLVLIVKSVMEQVKEHKLNTKAVVLIAYSVLSIIAFDATIRDPYLDAPTVSFYRYYFAMLSLYIFADKLKPLPKRLVIYVTFLMSFITAFLFSRGVYFY